MGKGEFSGRFLPLYEAFTQPIAKLSLLTTGIISSFYGNLEYLAAGMQQWAKLFV